MTAKDAAHNGQPDPRAFELFRGMQALEHTEQATRMAHVEPGAVVTDEVHRRAIARNTAHFHDGGLTLARALELLLDDDPSNNPPETALARWTSYGLNNYTTRSKQPDSDHCHRSGRIHDSTWPG